ncbi:MAG: aldehyde ferredoxin oxidoreductase family protein, partial [Candidatus Heimdallarchaeaceae archaeon]
MMKEVKVVEGTNNKILEINLSTRKHHIIEITREERELFLGGKGLALYYLYKKLDLDCEPLSSENILAIFTGVMVGTGAPNSSRFSAVTKSPLTGLIVSSSCGGPFGFALKTAGYDGLLISGKAEKPIYIEITNGSIEFKDASNLWGKDTVETQTELGGKKKGILTIGPAGENQVLYANVASGHRFFGRGGIGAVFGAKNLKAIVVEGEYYKIRPKNEKKFKKVKKRAVRYTNRNDFTSNLYRNYGTNANVNLCNEGAILPVRNFSKGKSDQAWKLAGETLSAKYYEKYSSCRYCAILCGHKGIFNGQILQAPEYETTSLFGSNLEIYDPEKIAEWNNLCGKLGLDTMSTAVTLAYVMEAGEKGLLSTTLKFGSPDGITEMLKDIAYRKGLGDELARGTRWLSKKYGGTEFAIQVKGLEMAGYDPRGTWGQALAYSVANRGACHLSATMFAIDNFYGLLKGESKRAKPQFVWYMENLNAAINSLQICVFTLYAYILESPIAKYLPKPILKLAMRYFPKLAIKVMDVGIYSGFYEAVTGIPLSQAQFLRAGERIHVLERYMNTLIGVSRNDDTLPARFLQEGRESDPHKYPVPIDEMIDKYYTIRGYSIRGIPKAKTLSKLKIDNGIQPKPKKVKKSVISVVFTILGRALQTLSKLDSNIMQEVKTWPDNYKLLFKVDYHGPTLGIIKDKKGHLKPRRITEKE